MQIVDDTPTANDDSNTVTEDGIAINGNVYVAGSSGDVADRQGADSNATPITGISHGATNGTIGVALAGNYGNLVLNANGSYSYAVDNNNAVVNTLKTGESLTEIYTYTLTDADGDTDTATLIITINGNTDGAPSIQAVDGNASATGETTVFEAGLTSVGDTSETNTGTIAISAADGIQSISIGGTTVSLAQLNNLGATPITINTGKGEITLIGYSSSSSVGGVSTSGIISYSYTLTAAQNTPGATESTDIVSLSIQDAGGSSNTGSLTIQIIDDIPTANNDTNSVTEDGVAINGNVYAAGSAGDVADRQGADSTATPITGISMVPTMAR
nr:VCBS domain-containing protein [Methylocucumis oryzae]